MKTLRKAVADYLALRRSLGFKLAYAESCLRQFVSFFKEKGSTRITAALALEFATQRQQQRPSEGAKRLSVVRAFAAYYRGIDPRTEVPPRHLLPNRPQRAKPYFYSEDEIRRILEAAQQLPADHGLDRWTYYCLLGLLAVTGMRLGETINLQLQDIDWAQGLLTIRNAKFGKSRLIPLDASTLRVLAQYAERRDGMFPRHSVQHFFLSRRGTPLYTSMVEQAFHKLLRQIGCPDSSVNRRPRLHDFRHRFVAETLKRWYRSGEDVDRLLPVLSTYLGHVLVTGTYWYITHTPELMAAASKRVEKRWRRRYEKRP